MGFAHAAVEAATATPTVPDGYPVNWVYGPDTYGWPPGWPQESPDEDATLDLTADATVSPDTAFSLECRTLDEGGSDTSAFAGYMVTVSAALSDETVVQVKKVAGDDYANEIYYYIDNYSGSKYGFDETLFLDVSEQAGAIIAVTCTVECVEPVITAVITALVVTTATVSDGFAYGDGELETVSSEVWVNNVGGAMNVSGGVLIPPGADATDPPYYNRSEEGIGPITAAVDVSGWWGVGRSSGASAGFVLYDASDDSRHVRAYVRDYDDIGWNVIVHEFGGASTGSALQAGTAPDATLEVSVTAAGLVTATYNGVSIALSVTPKTWKFGLYASSWERFPTRSVAEFDDFEVTYTLP